jgi:hypothetical protein
VPGVRISEHFPQVGKLAQHLAIIRSMNSKEGDHGRATYLLRTGYVPQGPIQYPSLGALVSKELGDDRAELPNFVSVAPFRVLNQGAFGSGFLGPRHAPLIVGEGGIAAPQQGQNGVDRALRVQDLAPPAEVGKEQTDARIALLKQVQRDFLAAHPDVSAVSHQNAYERAVRLMKSAAAKAFDLDDEKAAVRDAYGRCARIAGETPGGDVDAALLSDAAEQDLAGALTAGGGSTLDSAADLAAIVERFFDEVLVMAEDDAVRANRLRLVANVRDRLRRLGDFSQLPG